MFAFYQNIFFSNTEIICRSGILIDFFFSIFDFIKLIPTNEAAFTVL